MIPAELLVQKGEMVELTGTPYADSFCSPDLCKHKRFYSQPMVSGCSGFLVKDDILVSAGHCFKSQQNCTNSKWVFDYKVEESQQHEVSVSMEDVYICKKIIKRELGFGIDYAVIQLDRPNPGRALTISKTAPSVGTSLVMIGHPWGLPRKITDGAKVRKAYPNCFVADLDSYKSNSGSGVFKAESGELVGISVSGKYDYRMNVLESCMQSNVLPSEQAGEGVSLFTQLLPHI